MRLKIIAAVVAVPLALSGCLTAKGFFGTDDPCLQAEAAYATFLTFDDLNPGKVAAKHKRSAAAGIAGVRAQCSDGSIDKVTLIKLVRAYSAGLAAWKKGE